MRRSVIAGVILAAAVTAVPSTYANAQEFHAKFLGFNEVPLAILSKGEATLALKLNQKLKTLNYTLTYSNLSAPVVQAHIHFGKVHVAGSVMVFLCGSATNPGPVGTPICPAGGGTVTGMLVASNVLPVPAQGIAAGDFDAVIAALLSRTAYANIHTNNFPAGEIRGQVRRDNDEDDQDHDD